MSLFVLLLVIALVYTQEVAYSVPTIVSSSGGLLEYTLNVQRTEIPFDGTTVRGALTYNDLYIPPLFRVNPGDLMKITVNNNIDVDITNVHFHGLHITQEKENPFISISPGASWTYELQIPTDHPTGLAWYHAHPHDHEMKDGENLSEMQVHDGLSGGIILNGITNAFPQINGLTEKHLLLKDLQYLTSGGPVPSRIHYLPNQISSSAPTHRTVNGVISPNLVLSIAPGEAQIWRVWNIGADIWYDFNITVPFHLLALDSRPVVNVEALEHFLMGPGTRCTILVVGPDTPGDYPIMTNFIDNYLPFGDQYPETQLAVMRVTGSAVTTPALPTFNVVQNATDLRSRVTNRRQLHFNQTVRTPILYYIDGKLYDPDRVDIEVPSTAIEEWDLWNDSTENHWFHLHQTDFQVIEFNGAPVDFIGYQDTCDMPAGGHTKIIIDFTHPHLKGNKILFHCHIMAHEATGMMAIVQVSSSPLQATLGVLSLLFAMLMFI